MKKIKWIIFFICLGLLVISASMAFSYNGKKTAEQVKIGSDHSAVLEADFPEENLSELEEAIPETEETIVNGSLKKEVEREYIREKSTAENARLMSPKFEELLSRLPRRNSPPETHTLENEDSDLENDLGTSEDVLLAGEQIGLLEEELEKNSELLSETLAFYRACATNTELVPSVRALCYFHLKEHSGE